MWSRPEQPDARWREVPVLVTGGAGFIGSHLVDALVAAGARVRVLDDLSQGRRENLAAAERAGAELVVGDLRDGAVCHRACAGVRIVFHQAALGSVPRSMSDPAATVAVNVAGTTNVFTAARDAGVARVVYASSSSVYGEDPRLPRREGQEGPPLSPYALSKVINEQLAEVFQRCFGLSLIGLRYFNVYGPRQDPAGPYAAVIPRFFRALAAGQPPIIYGDGGQSRDFTFVSDAVTANLLAALAPASAGGRAYNVGSGRGTTVLALAELLRQVMGGGPAPIHEGLRAGDVRDSQADPALARQQLGFVAQVPLERGLELTRAEYPPAPGAEGGR